ncbi:MAG: ABC transporter permease [Eubacteriales bacterium]
MFKHIFINRLKCLLRDRQLLFWTFVWPLMLAALFGMAFSNIGAADAFKSIPIAVVNNAQYQGNATFQAALQSVSDKNPQATNQLFSIKLESEQDAATALENNEVKGYILVDNGLQLFVKNSDIDQSIIKQFLDTYLQTSSAYKTIALANPSAAQHFTAPDSKSYISAADTGSPLSNGNGQLISFYGLIGMACLFGGFWGRKQISDHQADLSPQGARINMAPVHKLKSLGFSLLAAICIQFASLLVLLAFLNLVLKIDFGSQIGYILLTCLAGSVVGVAFGA